jgi:hypothetical protein
LEGVATFWSALFLKIQCGGFLLDIPHIEINPTKVGFSLLLLGIAQASLTLPSLTRRVPVLKPDGFRWNDVKKILLRNVIAVKNKALPKESLIT